MKTIIRVLTAAALISLAACGKGPEPVAIENNAELMADNMEAMADNAANAAASDMMKDAADNAPDPADNAGEAANAKTALGM